MSYTYLLYLLAFLPGVLLVYAIVPQRFRGVVLLLASYAFLIQLSRKLSFFIVYTTISVFLIGLWLSAAQKRSEARIKAGADRKTEKRANTRRRRAILWLGILSQGGVLFFLKFYDCVASHLNLWTASEVLPVKNLILPLGISFYTLEAISYLVDVYYRKIEAERNIGRMALFLSFFPIIMEGPICRYGELARPLWEGKQLTYRNLTFGAQRLLWGLFKKWIIADRLSPLVSTLFNHPDGYQGGVMALAGILYTLQLYADFSGCIDMTIGTGEMFGLTLPENFRQPFFAKNPSEFWRRWHITLGAWFKDYIFYPLSLTSGIKKLGKSARKKLGKHYGQIAQTLIPLFAVWLCNGVWHGTGWTYLFYGMYYFVLIVAGELIEPVVASGTEKLGIDRSRWPWRILQTVKMLAIIFTGELFFRATSMPAGWQMFRSIFTGFGKGGVADGALLTLGITFQDYLVAGIALAVVLVIGILHERGVHIRECVAAWPIVPRWCFYFAALFVVLIFGVYGAGHTPADLIYAGF